MAFVPPARHLLRARDLVDARYAEPLDVDDLARAAGLSRAHFSPEFRRAFGDSPHQYLLTRRLERAAALLRNTDRSVTDICFSVGLARLGSFPTGFTPPYGLSATPDRSVPDLSFPVALASLGSFTTSFTRTYGMSPTASRASSPPASRQARVPM